MRDTAEFWRLWLDAFDDIRWDPEEIDRLRGQGPRHDSTQSGHGSGSGVAVSEPVFQLFTFRRGLVDPAGGFRGSLRRPSKPPGCRSRRCRRRTSSCFTELLTPSTDATSMRSWRCIDPDVEFTPFERALEGLGPYRGHDGVRTWWKESFSGLAGPQCGARRGARPGSSDVRALGRLRGSGAWSGASFERTLWHGRGMASGKVVWWHAFGSEAKPSKPPGCGSRRSARWGAP